MASVRRAPRNPQRWETRYRDPSGRERTQTFDRKSYADAFAAEVEASKQRGEFLDPALRQKTVGEVGQRWIETKLDPNTRAWNANMLRHVNEHWERTAIGSLDYLAIQE